MKNSRRQISKILQEFKRGWKSREGAIKNAEPVLKSGAQRAFVHARVASFRALWSLPSLVVKCMGKQYEPAAVFERCALRDHGDTPSRALVA